MKKLVVALILITLFLVFPSSVKAEDQVCTEVYGGGVVCGAKHEAVDTGIEDILNPTVLGFASLGASGLLLVLSKKIKAFK
jgi:hypothetical protein